MNRHLNKILLGGAALLLIIQFIRPARNVGEAFTEKDITRAVTVPDDVMQILKVSCYDCHSNHTEYPWYVNIQPAGWLMQNHVNEGKSELNFSEFAAYELKKQKHKFEEIEEVIQKKEMPLSSYLWLHRDAALSPEQAEKLTSWAASQLPNVEGK